MSEMVCVAANSTRSSGYFSNFVLYASMSNEAGGVVGVVAEGVVGVVAEGVVGVSVVAVAVTASSKYSATMEITEAVSIILRMAVVEMNDINR